MKVLILSHSDLGGGAARAAYRLHQGLKYLDVRSEMLVQYKLSDDNTVLVRHNKLDKGMAKLKLFEHLDALPLKFSRQRPETVFSLQWLPDRLPTQVAPLNSDLINLHWTCKGYIKIETLAKLARPLVWTLHDMWAFTGGCHYTQDCDRYQKACGNCPQLHSSKERDLSRWVWQRKVRAWDKLDLTVVTPSRWLAKCASASTLLGQKRVEAIPNSLDTQLYKPLERRVARERLNLPQDRKLVLCGALMVTADRRKGLHLLQLALQRLSQSDWSERLSLVVFGASTPGNSTDCGLPTHYLGSLSDDVSLALVYAAADVFVAPSLQDNLPNTVLEALACGTPCVAFNIGGMPDAIAHQQNGYLARPYAIEELAQGIAWVLEDAERHQKLSHSAREKAEQEFALERQAKRYSSLFSEILTRGKTKERGEKLMRHDLPIATEKFGQ